jgi:glucuronate isomerase
MVKIIDNPRCILRSSEAGRIYDTIKGDPIFDFHTHLDWRAPFAKDAWDLLRCHYFTEMAYSQGFPSEVVGDPTFSKEEKVKKILRYFSGMHTTTPYWWLVALLQIFFDFEDNCVGLNNFERICKVVKEKSKQAGWIEKIKQNSNIERIALTNSPWEEFDGLNSEIFIPTFRVDSLLKLESGETFEQIEKHSKTAIATLSEFEEYVSNRFRYFVGNNARSAAVSLPPNFCAVETKRTDVRKIFEDLIKRPKNVRTGEIERVKAHIVNYVAELCRVNKMPFQLMIGSKREVYNYGVPGGRDKSEPVSSLDGLLYMLNTYHDLSFPISVVSQTQSQELAECARIFRNAYASGHWWYTNTEKEIENSLAIRLELAPHSKHLGQYSDAYTMELIWPKYDMYRRVESNVFAEKYVQQGKLSIDETIEIIRERDYKTPKRLMGFK